MPRRTLFVPLVPLTVCGCSLMGLGDIVIPPCTTDDECIPLDRYMGLPDTCRGHRCDPETQRCVAFGEVEAHDGADNDCDGLIDEPWVAPDGEVRSAIVPEFKTVIEGVIDPVGLAYEEDGHGVLVAAWRERGESSSRYASETEGATTQGVEMRLYRDAEPNDLLATDLDEGCWRRLPGGGYDAVRCYAAEVAFGLTSERALIAAVNDEGCAPGQTLLGFLDRGEPARVVVRGPARRSNCYLGLDLTDDGACTGGSRPGCSVETRGGCGLARPALAVVEEAGRSTQALITWIGAPMDRDRCGGEVAPVECIAAFLMTGSYTETFQWVTASNEGTPQQVGMTTGGGSPAVEAIAGGFLIGFGDDAGGLSLHFVPRPSEPRQYDGHTCCEAGDEREECDGEPPCSGPEDRTGYEVPSLGPIVELEHLDPGGVGRVDHVAIAHGHAHEGELRVGVTWREGCGQAEETIFFRMIRISTGDDTPAVITDVGRVVTLGNGQGGEIDLQAGPAVAFVGSGFVVEGYVADDGSTTAGPEETGGWIVAWVTGERGDRRIVGRRVRELDGRLVDDRELIGLSEPTDDAVFDATAPGLFASNGRTRVVFHDSRGERIIEGEM